MKTVKGKVFPRMNSQIAATFIAIPPKKYHDPETLTMEVLFEPLNSRKQNMVHEYGTRKPRTPSRVGLPARTRRWSVQVFLRNGIVGAQAFRRSRHTESFGEVTLGPCGLEEKSLVLLRREGESDLATEGCRAVGVAHLFVQFVRHVGQDLFRRLEKCLLTVSFFQGEDER